MERRDRPHGGERGQDGRPHPPHRAEVLRVIALGASNLTRGLQTLVAAARQRWGREVEVLAALGHGRSYGATSRVLVRTLPGILQSGLWRQLAQLPSVETRALVTDVGNDILYGSSASQILAWVEQCLERLQRHTRDIVLTDLPLARIRRLSRAQFLLFRSVLFPSCRLSLAEALLSSERVAEGLAALAKARGVRLFHQKQEWYGLDPIHIRPRAWRNAWQEILCGEADGTPGAPASWAEWARLYLFLPERQWLLGRQQLTPQLGRTLARGGRLWLY